MLAQGAALAVALEAAYVHLHARLGEREVGGTQTGAGIGTEQLLHEGVQRTLQVAQRDALIHDQTFHLVEHVAVGSVGVRAEDAARDEHLDGRLLAVHGADLAAGSLGAEQELIGQVEGVLHIAGGMVLRDVQAGEVVVVVLDLGGICHSKAHAREDVDDLVGDEGQGVQTAHGAGLGGQGDVHRLGGVAGSKLSLLHLVGSGVILGLHPGLQFVDDLAHGRPLLGGDRAQILHQGGDLAVLAQIFLPESCQRFFGRDLAQALFGLLCQLVDHCLHGCSLLLIRVVQRTAKKLRPLPRPPERPGKRDEALKIHSSAVPPGFRPALSQAARRSKRRNGAHRPALLSFRPAARERTSACARAEALSAGEASLFAAVRLPTLSVAAFGVFRSWSF